MKTILLLIQIISFVSYVAYVWRFKSYSISETWYLLGNKGWVFSLFTWSIGVPMLFYGNALFWLSGTFMCFVGTATMYKDEMTGWVHNVATIGAIIMGFAATAYEESWSGLYFFIVLGMSFLIFKISRMTWWVEITAFFCVMMSIYFMD